MAMGVARITTYGYIDGTMSGGSAVASAPTNCNDYNGPPLMCAYYHNGTTWTQQGEIMPWGVSCGPNLGDGLVMTFLGFKGVAGTGDQLRLQWGANYINGNNGGYQVSAPYRTQPYTILAFGQ